MYILLHFDNNDCCMYCLGDKSSIENSNPIKEIYAKYLVIEIISYQTKNSLSKRKLKGPKALIELQQSEFLFSLRFTHKFTQNPIPLNILKGKV